MNTAKPDGIAVFCLTPGGVALAQRLQAQLPVTCFTRDTLLQPGFIPFAHGFAATVRAAFSEYSALVFICATGIAVRVLAPLLEDKFSDPAVLVMDERGQHVISLLSGHVGGANALTQRLAGLLGADPVITTATDVNELAALDTLACALDARMPDFRAAVKRVNQLLVSGGRVGLWWDLPFRELAAGLDTRGFITVDDLEALPPLEALVCISMQAQLPVACLKLVPQRIVAGMGCRRDTPPSAAAELLAQTLATYGLDPLALKAIGSIDLKADEAALIALAAEYQVPFHTFCADALREFESRFTTSDFVRQTTGVGAVSGPAVCCLGAEPLSGDALRERGVTLTLGVIH